MKSKFVVALVVFGAVLSVLGALAGQSTTSLAGSWQFTLTPSGPVPTPNSPPIQALATFTADGSVIETDSSEVALISPSVVATAMRATPGHGIWQPAPAIGNLFIQFISLVVNANQSLYARKTVTISGVLDSAGNNFSGNYGFTLVDPNGHVLTSGSGTVAGQRIPHPLLP
jgi:hypothetical protein